MSSRLERLAPRLLIPLSLAYGVVMVALGGTLFGLSPYHRLQAEALLHGHFYLGDSLEQMQPGLAWHDGHVQQVWGLGVGLWLLPFQAVWRVLSAQVFPDRIALGAAFALLGFYTGRTSLRMVRNGQPVAAMGFIWLILLCPPIWTLARASQLVFEETTLYGLLLSLAILVAVFRFTCFDRRPDYWLCCLLAALSGLVRPTDAVYGLCGVLVCSFTLMARRRALKEAILGSLLFAVGLALLAWTNWARFGSPVEFGHRLTATSDSMVYLTRFGNPYAGTGTVDASKELFGLLFLDSDVRDAGAYSENLFPGQASAVRWRRLYLTVFDPTCALLCLAAAVGAMIWFFRRRRRESWFAPGTLGVAGSLLWAVVSGVVLVLFYLRFPIVASRYLLDFAPAVTGLLLTGWLLISRRASSWCLLPLSGWLLYEIVSAKVPMEQGGEQPRLALALPRAQGTPLKQIGGRYDSSHSPADTGIAHNGYGWEPESGFAGDVVILAVDQPEFVEFRVSGRRGVNGEAARPDIYRAMMDGKLLKQRQTLHEEGGLKVVFDVPSEFQGRNQYVFLCFSEGYDAEDRTSERFLHSVHWR